MKDPGFALRFVVSTSLNEVVKGILTLRSRRDSGMASLQDVLHLMQLEEELDFVAHNLEGESIRCPQLVGRA
tara:strand:- start:809 stop:1024 length:216 start_codon:yes stop_codon:yes gene_type:complete